MPRGNKRPQILKEPCKFELQISLLMHGLSLPPLKAWTHDKVSVNFADQWVLSSSMHVLSCVKQYHFQHDSKCDWYQDTFRIGSSLQVYVSVFRLISLALASMSSFLSVFWRDHYLFFPKLFRSLNGYCHWSCFRHCSFETTALLYLVGHAHQFM